MALRIIRAVFVLLVLAGVPVLSISTVHSREILILPRKAVYFSAAVSQWLLALLTFVIALITPGGLQAFHAIQPGAFGKWVGVLTLISLVGLGVVLVLEAKGWWPQESLWVQALIPRTTSEKFLGAVLIAPTAGFCEEFVYRGYLLGQLSHYLHSTVWAWIVSSLAFGMAHAYQKPNGVVRASLLGGLLAWPVVRLGSVYPSMVAHFLIDAVALVWLGSFSLKRIPDATTPHSQ